MTWAALRWLVVAGTWALATVLLLSPGSPELAAGIPIPDKLAHLLAWAGMSGSLYLALAPPSTRLSRGARAVWAIAVGLAWGVATELLQTAIPLRSADPWDLAADAGGALIGVALAWALEAKLLRRR